MATTMMTTTKAAATPTTTMTDEPPPYPLTDISRLETKIVENIISVNRYFPKPI